MSQGLPFKEEKDRFATSISISFSLLGVTTASPQSKFRELPFEVSLCMCTLHTWENWFCETLFASSNFEYK